MSIETIIFLAIGFGFLLSGAELVVRGAAYLAREFGISTLAVGLTVVAFGTSAPELTVSLNSVYTGQADISVGNIVGSNILNILLVLGLASIMTPMLVSRQILRFDLPLMIGVSILAYLFALDGTIHPWQGLILFVGLVSYTLYSFRKKQALSGLQDELPPPKSPIVEKIGWLPEWLYNLVLLSLGLFLLLTGSRWLVDSSVSLARFWGISELVIGLTVVSIGTSLPEIATAIVSGYRKKNDIAVGNVVGSNLFNLMMVMGLTATVAPGGLSVSSLAISLDLPFMVLIAALAYPVFYTNWAVDRWEGVLFLLLYSGYTYYLVMYNLGDPVITTLNFWLIYFLLPALALLLGISFLRAYKAQGSPFRR